jgi:hypothetical protein
MKATRSRSKLDYSIEVRTRLKDGSWGDWKERGEGEWIDLNHFQSQIKMLIKEYSRDIQIKAIKQGELIDYQGTKTNKPIEYEKSR